MMMRAGRAQDERSGAGEAGLFWLVVGAGAVVVVLTTVDVGETVVVVCWAEGATAVIYPVFVTESLPPPLTAMSETEYFPGTEYVCDGFCRGDVVPSPNAHVHAVGLLDEVSEKLTVKGVGPEVRSEVKEATGRAGFTVV